MSSGTPIQKPKVAFPEEGRAVCVHCQWMGERRMNVVDWVIMRGALRG